MRTERPAGGPELPPLPPPTHADVPYGSYERTVLDFWKAEARDGRPPPLIVFIHGGGFRGGDKRALGRPQLERWLEAGLAVASVNYRLSQHALAPAPFQDGARAVQFLRSQAEAWGFDARRVACSGGSAGAGISLWIGFRDDMADPHSDDPVARQSTRLSCMLVRNGQTSYDTRFIRRHIQGPAYRHPALIQLFRLQEGEADDPRPEKARMMEETAPINFVTADDPPAYLTYAQEHRPTTPETDQNTGIHHPTFGVLLNERMDAVGVECVVRCGVTPPGAPDEIGWLRRHLQGPGRGAPRGP
ncbi:MAG: alpha/beta hydrolase fold domain-containing protein [Chloroflexota bacterium]